ncbi:MAG: HAD family hydrolase [Firmicutes bacterium]|nr:HAD family hydrolase [Bacillota bacterium]
MTKDYILFDLDGTLTDPEEGITNSVAYALGRFGIPVENRKSLDVFIGPPLDDSFMEYYGFDREKALRAISVFREYFRDRGIFENVVYPGIPEMLDGLKKSGKTLILATSKPEVFAVRILDRFGLSQYFTVVTGSLLDNTRTDKHEVIEAALEKAGVTDRTRAVMVGDREHDIIGAKKSSLASVGVTYGYGSREELEKAGADIIAENADDLLTLLLGL